jgi:hypothetical protein
MSSVDFRNIKSNLTDPHFRAQLDRLLHPAGRIADIESDDDDDPFERMPDEVVAALVAENQRAYTARGAESPTSAPRRRARRTCVGSEKK